MSNYSESVLNKKNGSAMNRHRTKTKVLAVGAGKGGVGKSSLSLNLSLALQQNGHKVLLLDGDLGLANLNVMLGLYPSATLEDVINSNSSLREIIVKAPSGIDFIPGATGTSAMASLSPCEHAGLIDSFNELTNEYDYLLVDTAAGLSDAVLSFMRSSQEIIVVICDEPTSITDAYALIKVMHKKYRVNRFNIVTNFVQSAEEGKSLFNKLFRVSDKFLNVSLNYIGAIPFDKKLQQGIKLQAPVVSRYPNACSTKAFIKLAESVKSLPWQTELNSNTGFFIQQMVYG